MSEIKLPDEWKRNSVTETIENRQISKVVVTSSLDNPTGDEIALKVDYTVNKLTSGNDTGIQLNCTDTASPGNSYFFQAYRGAQLNFYITNTGAMGIASITSYSSAVSLFIYGMPSATATGDMVKVTTASAKTNTSGNFSSLAVLPSYNQTSGTASNTDLLINRTETAVGSGTQRLIDAQVGTVTKFNVDNKGTVTNTGGFISNVTNVNSATYNILPTDYILSVSYTGTGAVTNLQLMTATCVDGRRYIIKDSGGNAGANTITVQTEGAEKIDGQDTYTINNNYGSITLYCYGGHWFIV